LKNIPIVGALAALAILAYTSNHWSWLIAVMGIAASFYFSRNARLANRVQLIFVGGLGSALAAEILRTFVLAIKGVSVENTGDEFRQIMIVSLGSVIVVLAAMIVDHLLRKMFARNT
jgi:hypothetical protein